MEKATVVILNWNGADLMKQFLPSVIAHTPRSIAEIVVADNHSTDDSLAMLQERFPQVRIIELDDNYGFAEGYNLALQQIHTPYCVLLNSDVEVSEGWIDEPLKMLDNKPDVAAVQPKIRSEKNKDYFEYAGASGGYLDKYGYPYCRGRVMTFVEKDRGQYDNTCDIMWATGACLFIRTEVYKKEGGLDADFFAHQEEIDMCWRLKSRGYRILCTPQSTVYHVGGATLDAENPRKTFLNFRNSLLMVYKNSSEKDLCLVLFVRLILDYVAALLFLLKGQRGNFMAVLKARKAFRKMKPSYETKRKENLRCRTAAHIPELMNNCLIVEVLVKRKKSYREL